MYTNDGDLPSLLVHDVVLAVSLVVFFSHLAFYQIGFRVEGMSCKTVRLSSIYLLYLLSLVLCILSIMDNTTREYAKQKQTENIPYSST